MKKIVLVAIAVFLAVFLLWPTTKYGSQSCYEGPPGLGGTPMTDCAPPEVFDAFGGGYRYISEVFSSGTLVQKYTERFSLYMIGENIEGHFFRPLQAVRGAVVASGITATGIYLSQRNKKH